MPAGWRLAFGLLDHASLEWRTAGAASSLAALDPAGLPDSQDITVAYASRFQDMRPAFGLIGLSEASALPVVTPLDANGQAVARPADMPVIHQRGIRVEGPLRSFALLAQSPPPMAWRELSLEIAPASRVGIASSRLAVRMQGVVYEKQ